MTDQEIIDKVKGRLYKISFPYWIEHRHLIRAECEKEKAEFGLSVHEAAIAMTLKEVIGYRCDECSTPNFIHLIIPLAEFEKWEKGEL